MTANKGVQIFWDSYFRRFKPSAHDDLLSTQVFFLGCLSDFTRGKENRLSPE
jgi:hypothetical protein